MSTLIEAILALFLPKRSVSTVADDAPTTPAVVGKDSAAQFIARWEGCKLSAYRDVAGIPTIGYGRTTDVKMGDVCTQEQADAWLAEEVETFRRGVRGAVLVPLNENQLAACTSLAYNIGLAAFRGSTLLRKLNETQLDRCCRQVTYRQRASCVSWLYAVAQTQRRRLPRRRRSVPGVEQSRRSCGARSR